MAKIPNYTRGLVLERATPNQVNLGQIEAAGAGARGAAQVLDVGAQVAQKIKQTNDLTAVNEAVIRRQKEDIDFRQNFQKERRDNPLGYAKEIEPLYKERDKAIMESLPSEEARQAYQSTAEKLNLRNYEEDLSWETKRSTEMFANKAEQSIKDLEVMAYRGVPLDELNRNRAATTLTLGSVLAQDELVKFDAKAEQRITESYIQGAIDTDPYDAKKLLDSKKYDEALGADSLNKLNDKVEKEIKYIETEAQKARQKRIKMFVEDPAGLAVMDGASTPDEVVSKQRELGVREGNISVIPKEQAGLVANQINGVKTSDEMITELQKVRQDYGDRYYNIALADLKKNGLSEDMTFLAMMNPARDKQLMDATFAMAKEGKNFRDLSKARDIMPKDVTLAVEERIEDLRDVFLAEGADVSGLNNKLDNIATYFTAQGMDVDSAAELATQWMVEKSSIGEVNGKNFRIPLEYTPDDIEDALELQMDNLSDVNTVGTGEFSTAALKRGARFVLSPDEEYYYLKNQIGTPVLRKGTSEILKFPILDIVEQLKEKRAKTSEKRKRELFEQNLLGFTEE